MLVLLTSGPLNVYSKVLISAHVLQHVLLLALAGTLIGSAVTVLAALRVLVRRRTWLAALLAAAPVALLAGAYAGPLLRLALDSHVAHLGLQMLALGGGVLAVLLVRAVLGDAPDPNAQRGRRDSRAIRAVAVAGAPVLLLLVAGIVLSTTDTLLAASWFGATGRDWRMDALADQHRGGAAVIVLSVVGLLLAAATLLRGTEPVRSRTPEKTRG